MSPDILRVEPDTVRLMTIHAAKGLEFPVVCMADLGRGVSTKSPDLLVEGERLGLRAAIVTSAPPRYLEALAPHLVGIAVHNHPAESPTTFANLYRDGHRTQFLRGRAETLGRQDIPAAWRSSAR